MLTACPACGAPIASLMGIGCRECGQPLREPVLFGVEIRRKPEKGAAATVTPSAAGIVPGGVLSCGLITGDMDLTGIGTVTHVEGNAGPSL